MTILFRADCPTTYHIKIGAIEASQSRNNNRIYIQSTMNQKSFVIAVILAAAALSVIASPLAYAQDTSETSTDQSVKQKNTGSGESTNFNCGNNLIKAGVDEQECEFED
jgi:hypothetical protein